MVFQLCLAPSDVYTTGYAYANMGINRGYTKRLEQPKTTIHIMVNLYSA
ncbi:hypothetical protein [Nostoc sp.]